MTAPPAAPLEYYAAGRNGGDNSTGAALQQKQAVVGRQNGKNRTFQCPGRGVVSFCLLRNRRYTPALPPLLYSQDGYGLFSVQQGTPQSATNFNHMEDGISNAGELAALLAVEFSLLRRLP